MIVCKPDSALPLNCYSISPNYFHDQTSTSLCSASDESGATKTVLIAQFTCHSQVRKKFPPPPFLESALAPSHKAGYLCPVSFLLETAECRCYTTLLIPGFKELSLTASCYIIECEDGLHIPKFRGIAISNCNISNHSLLFYSLVLTEIVASSAKGARPNAVVLLVLSLSGINKAFSPLHPS